MPSKSPQLGILHVAPHQHQPELRRDLGVDHADEATQGLTSHASASDIRITDADFRGYFMHKVTGSPAAAGHLWIPPIERRFAVWNTTGQNLYIRAIGQPWSTVTTLATATARVFYCDGTAVESLTLDSGLPQIRQENPDVGSLVLTGLAPASILGSPGNPLRGNLTLTGVAPSVILRIPQIRTPTVGSLAITGLTPTLPIIGRPATGTLVATGKVPTVI